MPDMSPGPKPSPSKPCNSNPLSDFLCFSLYAANLEFNHLYRVLLAELGLTYPQYLVMTLLWHGDDRTVSAIGQELGLESNTLTPLLKRLEALGLVERARDARDERTVRVRLSPKGKALSEKGRQVPTCVADAVGLTGQEMSDLIAKLDGLRRSLADKRSP